MAKSDKIEVSKITIKIGDKETPLTVEQAKELREALTALLGGDTKVIERIIERERPYYGWWIYQYDHGSSPPATAGWNNNTGNYTLCLSAPN